jgi:hypothetical protein
MSRVRRLSRLSRVSRVRSTNEKEQKVANNGLLRFSKKGVGGVGLPPNFLYFHFRSLRNLKMNYLSSVILGNYCNTFPNKPSFYSAFSSYLNSYIVFPSHQSGSLIHHFEYNSASL